MPYYEFECDKCGVIEEVFFPVIPKEIPTHLDRDCAKCDSKTMKKIISAPNFHLKGTCWAKDGYSMQYQDGSRVVAVQEPNHPEYPPEAKGMK